jgi:5-methylcytosine-specific restriction protein A
MPQRPRTPCNHPGCPVLVPYGQMYCEEHKALHPEATRSAGKRGYGSRWQKQSKLFLQSHPLCVSCLAQGRYTRATVVDHSIPHRGDPALFWDRKNWQPLCKPCHDKKTWTEDNNPEYRY